MGEKEYHYPAVTVDVLLFAFDDERIKVLLIERKNPPYRGCRAFPGGFIEIDETLAESAAREMVEETNVDIDPAHLYQFYAAGDPGRDPRGRTISVCYLAFDREENVHPHAADDAQALDWFPIHDPPELAFDHAIVLEKGIETMQHLLLDEPLYIIKKMLGREYSLEQFKVLLSEICNNRCNIRQIQEEYINSNILISTGKKINGKTLFTIPEEDIPPRKVISPLIECIFPLGNQ